jgi:DNA invertase Pin-like site-specific DNA recombinase
LERKTVEVLWPSVKEETVEKKSEKLKVAAYCRLSRQSDDKRINSLENQLKYYTHYIRSNDEYKLVGLYYDGETSGVTIDDRPGFKRLLRHCDEGLIDLVLTKSISRFSRNAKDLLEVVDHLSDLGIPVIFEKENINSLERKNKFFLTALAAVSQDEIVNIAHNSTWGKNKRILSGSPIYRRQFGYEIIKADDGSFPLIHQEEAEIVKEIYELFLEDMKINDIAKLLTDRGVKTVSGHTIWSHTLIRNILENKSYIGEKITNQKISALSKKATFLQDSEKDMYLIEDAYPRIISNECFDKVQKKLMEEKIKKTPGTKISHSCSKRIRCGLCNVNYHKNRKKYHIEWVCSVKQKQARLCESPRLTDKKILILMKEVIKERYDFENTKVLKEMKGELEWVNKNDRFEFHRLSLLSKLQIAKETLKQRPEDEAVVAEKEKVERTLIEFEHLATMIEEDRKYRNLAIEALGKAKSSEDFLERASIDVLRAWVMQIKIFSLEVYQVHWYDDLYTTVGNFENLEREMELKRERLINEELVLKPKKKKRRDFLFVEEYEFNGAGGKDLPSPILRGENVQAVRVEEYSSVNIIDRIRREIRESKIVGQPARKKLRIAVYARVSTDDPVQLGSLEAQMAYYTYAVLKNPDYRLVKVYYDEGVSGTKAENRAGFQQLVADCKKGKIDRVITKSISRFARNTVDCLEYVRELKGMGVSILFEKEEIDTAEKDGEILLTVYSALAQEESRSLGENITWSRRKIVERGTVRISTLPYGFDYHKDGSWEINREKALVVNRIFDEYLLGKSMLRIAKDLTQDEIPSPKNNNAWGQTTVRKILNNPAYIGDVIYQKHYTSDTISGKRVPNNGELPMYYIEDNHDAIIKKDKWDKVQEFIQDNSRAKQRKKPHNREEFYKLFECGVCGCPIIHIPGHGGVEKHYWRCRAATMKNHSDNCNEKGIREENIEHTFMTMLLEMRKSEKLTELVNEALEDIDLNPYELKQLEKLEIEIENCYQSLYAIVEDGKKHGEDTKAIKAMTGYIMELHGKIGEFEDRQEKVKDIKEELKWFKKELMTLEEFNPKKKRVPFRGDIFTRLIKSGTFLLDDVIEYQLSIGINWITKDNRKQHWKLPMKTK